MIRLAARIAELARLAVRDLRPAATIALGCAAASTGVVIPVLRSLDDGVGHGRMSASVFTDAHVLGGVVGAMLGSRLLRRAGSARRLATVALIASTAITLAMAALDSFELRVALRFLDGGCHLLAITALVGAATAGDPAERARRAVIMGGTIVLGLAGGLGVGGAFHHVAAALAMASVLSAAALIIVQLQVAAEPLAPALPHPARDRRPRAPGLLAPGLLAFCERFSFGSMTIAMPWLATPRRVGLVLGVFLTASVAALIAAWRYAPTLGPRRLAVRSALGFTLALAAAAAVDLSGSPAIAALWAVAAGASSGALYSAALVLAMPSAELADRARGMATVHAAGSAGHALGALSAGLLELALPGMLVISVPGVALILVAAVGVWITVPQAATDCPVIGALDAGARPPVADPTPPP
jgi:MFS family permease